MKYLLVGLGNPGDEYVLTRHNTGRRAAEAFAQSTDMSEFKSESAAKSLMTKGKIGKHDVIVVLPETFMNKSGAAAAYLARVKSVKPENVIVIYDDMDLPVGTVRMAFDRGGGGHHGLESVIKALKTRAFPRIRIGVAPTTPTGKLRKPSGGEKVNNFLLGKMKEEDVKVFKKIFARVNDVLMTLFEKDRAAAMQECNSGK